VTEERASNKPFQLTPASLPSAAPAAAGERQRFDPKTMPFNEREWARSKIHGRLPHDISLRKENAR
jgi:hypothetical protein